MRGIAETARWTTSKIDAIQELSVHTKHVISIKAPNADRSELVDLIFRKPYCRIADVVENGIARRQTASIYLRSLVDAGILMELDMGREKQFAHPKLIDLIGSESNTFAPYELPATALEQAMAGTPTQV